MSRTALKLKSTAAENNRQNNTSARQRKKKEKKNNKNSLENFEGFLRRHMRRRRYATYDVCMYVCRRCHLAFPMGLKILCRLYERNTHAENVCATRSGTSNKSCTRFIFTVSLSGAFIPPHYIERT